MTSELLAYMEVGVRHILDPDALDHVFFLVALSAIYRLADWRRVFWVVTSFTVGHSVTLALAVGGVRLLPTPVIEFLIPVTIVATCAENVLARRGAFGGLGGRYRPALAGVFGLIHGAGFANYLNSLAAERIGVPLVGFNLGIEIGQIAVLLAVGLVLLGVDRILTLARVRAALGTAAAPVRLRAVAISAAVGLVAVVWAADRAPW